MDQHALNVEYLRTKGWERLTDGTWIPTELMGGNSNPCSFAMAMNLQCDLDGEPRDMTCLAGALE